MSIKPKLFELTCPDAFELPAALFSPKKKSKGSILLCPGLGIPKELYYGFAEFVSQEGYHCLVFDYRGIGKGKFPVDQVNLRNWGLIDMPVAVDWLAKEFSGQKIYFFGHSIAGQIAGFMPNLKRVERFVFFCSTTGHPSVFDFPTNLWCWFMFNFHLPIFSRLFGYMPSGLTYRGVSIAKGVALEWAAWSRKKNYIHHFIGKTIPVAHYNALKQVIDWITFNDDQIATQKAVSSMMKYYPNAKIAWHIFKPNEMKLDRIGHAGFFTSKGKSFWRYPLNLIEGQMGY